MESAVHLPYTLQTYLGMVIDNGKPELQRQNPSTNSVQYALADTPYVWLPRINDGDGSTGRHKAITCFGDYTSHDWQSAQSSEVASVVEFCLKNNCVSNRRRINGSKTIASRFQRNINALRNPNGTASLLKQLTLCRRRVDLEQAAGLVVSAFFNSHRLEEAVSLSKHLVGVLSSSEMKIGELDLVQQDSDAVSHLIDKLGVWAVNAGNHSSRLAVSEEALLAKTMVHLLLRVRRCAPRNRCLYIPSWLFEETGMEPPEHHASFLQNYIAGLGNARQGLQGQEYPVLDPDKNSLVLSRAGFRALQRRVFRLHRFWEPAKALQREVARLESAVLYPESLKLEKLEEVEVAQMAVSFFKAQRQLQRKVVSDEYWMRFLAKGEGKDLYQNNQRVVSTFEVRLAEIAAQEGVSVGDDFSSNELSSLLDRTCLLMKQYVLVHGQGKKANLVFVAGRWGGSGRGPVDQYNRLCDMWNALRDRGRESGIEVPGAVYKFLAKDIMHWNNSWSDDAFYGDREHGWEAWIAKMESSRSIAASE